MKKAPAHNKGRKESKGRKTSESRTERKNVEPKDEASREKKDTGTEGGTQPIVAKEDVQQSNDEHIDQDFPGYPHYPSKDKIIHNGSAGAFDATEQRLNDTDSDDEEDDQETGDRKY